MYQPTFAKAAKDYESHALPQGRAASRLVGQIMETDDLKSISSIIDIGCGTAFAVKQLLNKFRDENIAFPAECVLVDQETLMLDVASKSIREIFNVEPKCVLTDAFDSKWTGFYQKHGQSLGRRVVISSYLLQWSKNPLDVLIKIWINLLNKGDLLVISFPDSRSFEWLRRSHMLVGLKDKSLKLFDSEELIGANAIARLSTCYQVVSCGQDNDSVVIKQPSDYLRHFSRIGSTPSFRRYSFREVKLILKALSFLEKSGHPCMLDYYSTWLVLKRL